MPARPPDAPRSAEDETLTLPAPPGGDDGLVSLRMPPAKQVDVEGDAPFLVAGRRAVVFGGSARGIDEAWAHPHRVLSALRALGGVATHATSTPLGVERHLDLGGSALLERVFVPPALPGVVVEWSSVAELRLELDWSIDLRAASAPLRWRHDGGVLLVKAATLAAAYYFSTTDVDWRVVEARHDGTATLDVRASLVLSPRTPIRLLALASDANASDFRTELDTLADTQALVRARAAGVRRLQRDRLTIHAADEAAVRAFDSAKQRLGDFLAETPGVGRSFLAAYGPAGDASACMVYRTPDAVQAALASLALGEFDDARAVLRFLASLQRVDGGIPRACTTAGAAEDADEEASLLFLFLSARYLSWSGDLGFAREEWSHVERAYRFCLLAQESAWSASVFAELAETAESVGAAVLAAEMRGRGGPPGNFFDAVVLHADAGVDCAHRVTSPAAEINALVYGVLGLQPDAPRNRLALRPSLPESWDRFEATNLRIGDAIVTFAYHRDRGRHRFTVEQEAGSMPLRLVFEPAVLGTALRSARIDGVDAELSVMRSGDRLIAPLQTMLEPGRCIELITVG